MFLHMLGPSTTPSLNTAASMQGGRRRGVQLENRRTQSTATLTHLFSCRVGLPSSSITSAQASSLALAARASVSPKRRSAPRIASAPSARLTVSARCSSVARRSRAVTLACNRDADDDCQAGAALFLCELLSVKQPPSQEADTLACAWDGHNWGHQI